jgi:hypothetical protein
VRAFMFLAVLLGGVLPASAEQWVSRHGTCFDWEGRWDVQQEQSGAWVGVIDFVHVGGPCIRGRQAAVTDEVRAFIVGTEFFARRTTGTRLCFFHGSIRNGEARGTELCNGANKSFQFAVRFAPPDDAR